MRAITGSLPLLAVLAAALGGCGQGDAPRADHAWVRLSPLPDRPSAAYLTLHGGSVAERVVAVTSPQAARAELHSMTMAAVPGTSLSMSAMRPLAGIDLPAHGTAALSPGGIHAMLFGVAAGIKPGDRMQLTVRLQHGPPIAMAARVVAAGDPAPY